MTSPEIYIQDQTLIAESTEVKLTAYVVLYNDEDHTIDEVVVQIMKAAGHSYEKSEMLTYEVHLKGKAIVFSGSMGLCLKVSSILEEIELTTSIVY